MRRVISLGLCALIFSLVSSQVFAGSAEDCIYLKDKNHQDYAPGLYGLCVAWHNANENAADKIAEKFFDRAGFVVPGSEDGNTDPQFACPCWDDVEFSAVCALGTPTAVVLDLDSGVTTAVTFVDFITFDSKLFGTEAPACGHVERNLMEQFPYIENIIEDLSTGEALDCQAELDIIAEIHLNNECPEL